MIESAAPHTRGRRESSGAAPQSTLTQIRNATLRLDYAGMRFLVDPMLGEKGIYPSLPGSANCELRNPLVSIPSAIEPIVDVDAVIVTHLHNDHWDRAAIERLDKAIPIFAQDEDDAARIRGSGFTDVRVLTEVSGFDGIRLIKTGGQHGTDAVLAAIPLLGKVCGVVIGHPDHKTVYIAGDTIWNRHVESAIERHEPDVIVVNCGKATLTGLDPIIMGEADVLAVHQAAPRATIVASHMEAMNHCVLSRADLQTFAERNGFATKLRIPADGETLTI